MTPLQIIEQLDAAIGIDGTPRQLIIAVEDTLISVFGVSAGDAAEHAERFSPVIARKLAERVVQLEREGLLSTLVVVGMQNDIVAGACHIFPSDDAATVTAKKHRVHSTPLLEAIKGLSADEFERFGACVLKELGAIRPIVTRQSGDQGIDFYGEISVGSLQGLPGAFFRLAHETRFYFAGQAKHYPTRNIGPDVLRELIGAVALARTKTYSQDSLELFEGAAIKPFSPLLALLFTTGGLSSGAVSLANAAGVIARSGAQLAVFLADRGVGMRHIENQLVFDATAFADWLSRV